MSSEKKAEKVGLYSSRVLFKVEHKKDFTEKKKHLKDGATIELHPNHAESLEKNGVGKILK